MRTLTIVAAAVLWCGASAQAQQQPTWGSTYDPNTGSQYNWSTNPSGTTRLNGYNYNTGSTWNQTIQPNGNQSGMDSRGNMWNYNAQTKTYMNYGTGKVCVNGYCY